MQRGLNRQAAAEYLGISPSTLDRWTRNGAISAPVVVAGKRLWDRMQLDAIFDNKPSSTPSEAWDEALQ